MKYGSVCSGIEAVTCAWHPLGLAPAWFAEIAAFPSAVLAARYPSVPNYGDFTRISNDAPTIDVLVGGTPCQSFSVSGGRAGLDDPRGHLAVEFWLLARRLGARWVVWENVPGVFSVDNGNAFETFISLAVECGYGVAWRVLDAQFCGVPQRRRRVFVVGYSGDWRPPCAVLFERPSLQRHPAARSRATAETASGVGGGAQEVGRVVNSLTAHGARQDPSSEPYVVETLRACAGKSTSSVGPLLAHHHRNAPDDVLAVVPIQDAKRSRVRKQHGIGVGNAGDPMFTGIARCGDHAVAFHATQDPISGSVAPSLATEPGCIGVSFDEQPITSAENRSNPRPGDPAPALSPGGRLDVLGEMRPRRLTPREWERLQGFSDDYTLIDGASDSARYEALGNSMAVPVMRWIGRRLSMVNRILERQP